MKNYYLRTTCRLCDSGNVHKVLPLAATALCDAYLREKREQEVYPLDLFQCKDCGFVQIGCVVDPEIIYRDYIYVTTSSSGLSNHFDTYSKTVVKNIKLNSGGFVIDIGSNDGTLLTSFQREGCTVLGVEPSVKTAEDATARGIETLPEFFDLNLAQKIARKYGTADLITINNLFANIDDLAGFTSGLEHVLSENGVLVIESSYLVDMVENMVFDFIYHEHLSYFSILPLRKFFARFGLQLIRVEHVGTKGGSLRYYWARNGSAHPVDDSVLEFTEKEKRLQIDAGYFTAWNHKIGAVKSDLVQILDAHRSGTIVGYGASATSTTLIYHFGLQKYLSYLVDENPGKIGTLSPGLHIPVKSPDVIGNKQSVLIVILAWRYKDLIVSKLPKGIKNIITPLPSISQLSS